MQQFNLLILATAMLLGFGPAARAERIERGGLVFDGIPAADAGLNDRLARYQQGRATRFLDWLADGSMLIATRSAGDEQLQRVTAPLAAREPLSDSAEAVSGAAAKAFANDSLAVIRQDAAGGATLYALDLTSHESKLLVPGSSQPEQPLWAHDGRRLAYASRVRTGHDADLYVIDAGGLPQLIASGGGDWRALDWSRDDRSLLALRHGAGGDQLLRVEVASVAIQALDLALTAPVRARRAAPPADPVHIRQARFSADGRSVWCLTDQESEFTRLLQLPLDGGRASVVTLRSNHDIERFDVSPDGRFLAYVYNDAGYSRLSLIDQRSGQEKAVTGLQGGVISALKFDRTGGQLAVNLENATTPPDVYVIDVASGATTRWTDSELGPLMPASLSVPQPVRFPTWDRIGGRARALAALVYRPTSSGQHAVLVLLPGGDGQPRNRFDLPLQALVNELNMVVVVPAVRGSAGLGRSFVELASGELRDDAVRDVGSLLVWIGVQPDMDRNRVAIMGSGASAYLSLAATARFGERLRGAIVIDDAPSVQTQAIARPVLLVRGVEDPPGVAASAEQLMWRLRGVGNPVWLLATAASRQDPLSAAEQPELWRVIAQFLQSALSSTPAADGATAPNTARPGA